MEHTRDNAILDMQITKNGETGGITMTEQLQAKRKIHHFPFMPSTYYKKERKKNGITN